MKRVLIAALCLGLAVAALVVGLNRHQSNQALQKELDEEMAATPTPTANISSTLSDPVQQDTQPSTTALLLSTGSKGDAVRQMQERLESLGYYNGEADGSFGSGTKQAVLLFQEQNGLTADGMVGEATWQALFSESAVSCVSTPTPAPTPTPSMLKKGDQGEAVRTLQSRLQELGYYTGKIDGQFGAGTKEALITFQRQNGLDADGIAAAKTFAVLYSDQAAILTVTPTPDPDQLPLLVNRTHPLEDSYQPSSLVKLTDILPSSLVHVKGSDIQGEKTAVYALKEMLTAAQAAGLENWQISAGYRSVAYQKELFEKSVQEYMDQGFSRSRAESATRQTVADPGTSEHHTGLAFDVTVLNTSQFKGTDQQKWLHKHCWDYGFIIRYPEGKEEITGYLAECWHIRYVGLPHSQTMYDKDQCLEEYLGILD